LNEWDKLRVKALPGKNKTDALNMSLLYAIEDMKKNQGDS
jgi:hypothetical protein